jgi:hypothetical protein
MENRIGIFSALLIAIASGLVVKVVGDPIVEVTAPKIDNFFDDIEDWVDDIGDAWKKNMREERRQQNQPSSTLSN